jgi:hypothetical protein
MAAASNPVGGFDQAPVKRVAFLGKKIIRFDAHLVHSPDPCPAGPQSLRIDDPGEIPGRFRKSSKIQLAE